MFSGMAEESILGRVSAPFQESTLFSHHELFLGRRNSDDSVSRSDSYISPISGCWFSSAYNSDVPDRHIPTTNQGPALIGVEPRASEFWAIEFWRSES